MKIYDLINKFNDECPDGSHITVAGVEIDGTYFSHQLAYESDEEYWYLYIEDGSICSGDSNIIIPNDDVEIDDDGCLVFNYGDGKAHIMLAEIKPINLKDVV